MRNQAGTSRLHARIAIAVAATVCLGLLAAVGAGGADRYPGNDAVEQYANNPCTGPDRHELLCPNLRISKPRDLFISFSAGGRHLLHATSSINSVGFGPLEIRGIRIGGRSSMRVNQRIHRRGGGKLSIRTEGRLAFYPIPGQYRYWKFRDAARFEIWSVDQEDHRQNRVRTGPKFYYCLRDLERTKPSNRSPGHPVYPGCNQDPGRQSVVLGTSVGWSDIYPADYHQQYINVSRLHGCYAFYLTVDPKNHIRETNEDDNESRILIRLPSGHRVSRC
jgi:lysyl oxidase